MAAAATGGYGMSRAASRPDFTLDTASFSSRRRNHMLTSHRRDGFIAWVKEMLHHSFVLDARQTYFDTFRYIQELVDEEIASVDAERTAVGSSRPSRLRMFVPSIGRFHTPLPLEEAFRYYDDKYQVTMRRHIPPTFNEIRHTFNVAQIFALKDTLQFVSFDGDQTLYEDGANFKRDSDLSVAIRGLLRAGKNVALITAAGYEHDGAKYERRLQGLLDGFADFQLDDASLARFFVVGGECNYYLRCVRDEKATGGSASGLTPVRLVRVSEEMWAKARDPCPRPLEWPEDECKRLLDLAEASLRDSMEELKLRAQIIRKRRGCGLIPGGDDSVERVPMGHGSRKIKREALDELVMRVQERLAQVTPRPALPICCFNGGSDVWVDIGNKAVGVQTMQSLLHVKTNECLHVGDQFLADGNDFAARETSPCIWIINPRETEKILSHLLRVLGLPSMFHEELAVSGCPTSDEDGSPKSKR